MTSTKTPKYFKKFVESFAQKEYEYFFFLVGMLSNRYRGRDICKYFCKYTLDWAIRAYDPSTGVDGLMKIVHKEFDDAMKEEQRLMQARARDFTFYAKQAKKEALNKKLFLLKGSYETYE